MPSKDFVPRISVIVLTWNGKAYIEKCLASLLSQGYDGLELLVVDNGSSDGTPELVARRFPGVGLIRNLHNLGFAAGNNVGLRAATGELLVLLNQDTEVRPGFLLALARTFEDPAVGIAGGKLLYPDGTIQHAGGYVYSPRGETGHTGRHAPDDGTFDQVADADFVTAAAFAISRTALARIGSLDEGFAPAYYEDVDWCYRARAAGFRVVYQPEAVALHHESTATTPGSHEQKFALSQGRVRFLLKHRSVEQICHEFGPAELTWVSALGRGEELMAARRAYLGNLLALPGILTYRGSSQAEAGRLIALLADLRAATLVALGVQPELEGLSEPARRAQTDAVADRTRVLDTLRANHAIREQPFASQMPVVGPLIVAVRNLWNSISTKWYVRPMMQQQSAFNSQVIAYLEALQQQITELDVAEHARELTAIAGHLAELERKMEERH